MVEAIGSLVRSRRQTGNRISKTVDNVWKRLADGVDGIDKATFTDLMNGLWEGCGRTTKPNETTLRVWYFCLHDLTERQIAHAIMRYLTERSSEYLSVQLLRELSGIQSSREAAACDAWVTAVDAVRIVGSYAIPVFLDPVISHVIANLGGWEWLCGQSPEQLRKFERTRFLKTYEAFAAHGVKEESPLKCLITLSGGIAERIPVRRITVEAADVKGTISLIEAAVTTWNS